MAALPLLVILSELQEDLHGSSIRRHDDASLPDVRQVIISKKPQKPRLMAAARDRSLSRPEGRSASTQQAFFTLSEGMRSSLLSPEGKVRLASLEYP